MKKSEEHLSKTDKAILNKLIQNSRSTFLEIAKEINLSPSGVLAHVRKLEKRGLIESYSIVLNLQEAKFLTIAFVGVYLDRSIDTDGVIEQLKKIDEVIECHYTTGNYSLFLKVVCKNNLHLKNLLNEKIQKSIKGINRTETIVSLNQSIKKQPVLT